MGRREHPFVDYYNDNRNFAELMNGWLYHGESGVSVEDIHSEDRRELVKRGERKKAEYRERYRDLYKRVDGINLRLLIGVEHQEHIHYAMPVRIMDYDSGSYVSQGKRIARRHKAAEDLETDDEWLSGFAEEDRLTPVVTLVLYCGKEPWNGALRLYEILDLEKVPEELRRYIMDYEICVLDVRHTSDSRLKEFPKDIHMMFLLLKYQDDSEKLRKCMREKEGVRIRRDTCDTIAEILGERRLKKIFRKEKGEEVEVCKAIDTLIADGEKRGIECGIEQGIALGIAQERKNTERERQRADQLEARVRELERMLEYNRD